jgi:ribosomal protein S18 acetylase RimI-like enzyme
MVYYPSYTPTRCGDIEFLPISDSDMPFLFEVYASTRQETLEKLGWTLAAANELLTMQFELQHRYYTACYPNASFCKVLVKGRDAGRLIVDDGEKEMRIVDLSLLEAFRNRGVGTMMMRSIMEESKGRARPITLYVERGSPAMRFYRRLGFERISETDTHLFLRRSSR